MDREQLAAAFERAQREITMPQQQPMDDNATSAAREHDSKGLEGTSLGHIDPIREPFNNAARGQQQSNDAPRTPELELRPPAPAPSPPGMDGPDQNPFPPMVLPNAQEVQERADAVRAMQNEAENSKAEKDITGDTSNVPTGYPSSNEEIKGHVAAFLDSDGPVTKEEVDARVAEVEKMQAKHDAKQEVQEWANGIRAMERQNGEPEHEIEQD